MVSKCYLTQPPGSKHDIGQLWEFGTPVILYNRGFFPDDPAIFSSTILQTLPEKLWDFDPEKDYIVPLGDSCVVAQIVAWIAGTSAMLPIRMLKYDKKLGGYYSIKIGVNI